MTTIHRFLHLALLCPVSLLFGCEDVTHLQDTGGLCIYGQPLDSTDNTTNESASESAGSFHPGVELEVTVWLGWTEGCAKKPGGECSVERKGQTLRVSASGWYGHQKTRWGKTPDFCSAVELPVQAHCSTPALEPGVYQVQYGEAEVRELVIPSESVPVVGDVESCW